MSSAEKISKGLNTPEQQEKINKFFDEFIANVNDKNNKVKEILSNTDYAKWLEFFTREHLSFTDDDWLYFPEKISNEDLEQVYNLSLMYNGIEKYANKNYIYPTACDFGNFYKIKFENTGFEIGRLIGQGTLFFCNRVDIENEKDFIDFIDVINNKKNDSVDTIKNKLNDLSNYIVSLSNSGIPLEDIVITLDNTLNEINSQKDLGQTKILKRK